MISSSQYFCDVFAMFIYVNAKRVRDNPDFLPVNPNTG